MHLNAEVNEMSSWSLLSTSKCNDICHTCDKSHRLQRICKNSLVWKFVRKNVDLKFKASLGSSSFNAAKKPKRIVLVLLIRCYFPWLLVDEYCRLETTSSLFQMEFVTKSRKLFLTQILSVLSTTFTGLISMTHLESCSLSVLIPSALWAIFTGFICVV